MAHTKSPGDGGRARGSRDRDEWSCRVCTLLNSWRERRCGACDTERPADVESQPSEWNCEVCTLANEWTVLRCVACEHDRPASTSPDVAASSSLRLHELSSAHLSRTLAPDENTWTMTDEATPTRSSRKRRRTPSKERATTTAQERPVSPHVSRANDMKKEVVEEGDFCKGVGDAQSSREDHPEAPTFNLLSFINGAMEPPVPSTTERRASDGSSLPRDFGGPCFNLLGGPTVGLSETAADGRPLSTNLNDSESQLAKAGLRLSDSESEDNEEDLGRSKRVLRRRLSLQPTAGPPSTSSRIEDCFIAGQEEWECSVCTNVNAADSVACELCNTNRDRSGTSERKLSGPANKLVPCPVGTHLHLAHASACEACRSTTTQSDMEATFTCAICTNVNPAHLDQCEMCETKRRAVSCPVCTSLNDASRKRCEVCESILGEQLAVEPPRSTRDDFNRLNNTRGPTCNKSQNEDDIYVVQADRYRPDSFYSDSSVDRESVRDFEGDFDDSYGQYPTSPTRTTRTIEARGKFQYRDDVEDISDNETYNRLPANTQQPAQSRRPELRDFEHFLTVEDARLDYQCQIDYRSMFAESSRSRSYTDRLQKRRRESQKRKRLAAEKTSGQQPATEGSAKGRGKKKAAKAGGKKAKAAERRASTGRPPAKAAKKPRTSAKPRRSSAPTQNAGINHYDTIGEDIGGDVTTMAWEGVGSAGYF